MPIHRYCRIAAHGPVPRAQDVASKPLETVAVVGRDRHAGVQAHAPEHGAACRRLCCEGGGADRDAKPGRALAGARSDGNPALHGRRVERSKQRIFARQRIGLVAVGVRSEAGALERASHSAGRVGDDA